MNRKRWRRGNNRKALSVVPRLVFVTGRSALISASGRLLVKKTSRKTENEPRV